jgi:anti-sigma-K factor RskA
MTHDQLIDSAASYALGALDAGEQEEFETHLRGCAECTRAVDQHREVMGLLAYAAAPVRPANPDALRDRVLRDVRAASAAVVPISRARAARGAGSTGWWIAIAASIVVAAVGLTAYGSERSKLIRAETDLAAARADIARMDSTVAAFLGPEVHVVSLSEPQRKPAVRVFWNHTRNVFIVTAFELPPAPPGKTYQLWAMPKGKTPSSMGTFQTDANGRATRVLAVASAITDAGFIDDCGLTLEPAGGSPQPTERPRLLGAWRHTD